MVLNNKTIDDGFHKDAYKEFGKNNKNIFQKAKNLFNLRAKNYKKLLFEREHLKPEETIAEKVKLKKQRLNEIKAK